MIWISIAAFCTAYYIVKTVMLAEAIKKAFKIPGRVKPIDCVQCLTVWIAIFLCFLPIEVSQYMAVIFGAGFISIKVQ